jgi:hypothetical protein
MLRLCHSRLKLCQTGTTSRRRKESLYGCLIGQGFHILCHLLENCCRGRKTQCQGVHNAPPPSCQQAFFATLLATLLANAPQV